MSSLFDFDNSQDLVFTAKTAGKQIISAKHEALTKLGAFLFLAHSDREFALRCQMFDNDITAIANRRLATVSDSKGKLVRALHAEWTMRHANCKCAASTRDYTSDNLVDCPDCKDEYGRGTGYNKDYHLGQCKTCKGDGKITKSESTERDVKDKVRRTNVPMIKGQGIGAIEPSPMRDKAQEREDAIKKTVPMLGSKGDQKDCAECGAPATEHDVRGYLELCANCAGKKSASVNDSLKADSKENNESTPVSSPGWEKKDKAVEASFKFAHSSCDCGEEAVAQFNGQPKCIPGMGCSANAQEGSCPGCGQAFHGFNVCPGGNCKGDQIDPRQDLLKELIELLERGESLPEALEHDEEHDDWAAKTNHGQYAMPGEGNKPEAPVTASKIDKKKKKEKGDHYKYIKKQGDSWVVTQKGTGKVLSHHDSKEDAIASFKAMMANKHGSKVAHHHDFDDEEEHYSGDSITGLPLKLVGQDGNAFAILGAAQKTLRRAGLHDEHWNNYHTEATSGDYNHLLATTMKYFDVH